MAINTVYNKGKCISSSNIVFGFIFILQFITTVLYGQLKEVGLPFISNFSREDYQAGTQNWSITQDNNGLMYFANNLGVLRFDGTNWQLFPLPNNSRVCAVLFSKGKIFAGGFDEFGYFSYNENGDFIYTSLSEDLNEDAKNFDEIWRIYNTRYGIVFQSFQSIFILKGETLYPIKPKSKFGFSYVVDNNLFVIDRKFGLYILQGTILKPLFLNANFFVDNEVPFIFSLSDNNYLIGTTNRGVFLYDGRKITPWKVTINELFIKYQIYSAYKINETQFAIGTIQDGVFIIDENGAIIQHVDRIKGLQNTTILSIFYDRDRNLWLGLDNGIDMLEISSPISILNYSTNIEASYTSIVHNNILYIGTNQGLFARDVKSISNESLFWSGFRLIEGTKGQVWKLKVVGDDLICGHNLGTFLIKAYTSYQLSDFPGGWDYLLLPSGINYLIGGTYNGLVLYEKHPELISKWKCLGLIKGFSESCKELEFDKYGNLWVSHGYKGLFKLELNEAFTKVTKVVNYNSSHGLPELPYTLSRIKNKLIIVAPNGLYAYDQSKDTFMFDNEFNLLFGVNGNLTRMVEDYIGDVWFFTTENIGVYRLQEDGSYSRISIPFNRIENQFLSNAFENIYTYDNRNVFIGGQRGMFHYNPGKNKDFEVDYKVFISEIVIKREQKDSTISEMFGVESGTKTKKDNIFPFRYNSLSFSFISPFYEASKHMQYSFRLKGFETMWSNWTSRNIKEYTNLYEGDYEFEVKAKNIYNRESEITSYHFVISPPFYRSLGAYIVYIVVFILIIVMNYIYFKRRVDRARAHEKVKHQRLLQSKEREFQEEVKQSEEQIERLRNDKLKNDMRHKNMELANATMHLINKNKFLSKLKGDLMKMWGEAKVDSVKTDIKQIVKKIDKDFKNEKQWKVFDKYFDEVHQDFVQRIKENHPGLTPNDLRLCAYLRMNLSTKEIAPLMNITVRGLEISRYRLRKKLELNRDTNLIEYIFNI